MQKLLCLSYVIHSRYVCLHVNKSLNSSYKAIVFFHKTLIKLLGSYGFVWTWTFNGGTETTQDSLKNILICASKINQSLLGLEWH